MARFIKWIIIVLCAVSVLSQDTQSDQFTQWDNQLQLSVPRSAALAVTVKNYAVIGGGVLNDSITHSDAVDVVDVTTRQIYSTKLPAPRVRMVATAVGQYAIFAAGYEYYTINSSTINSTAYNFVDVLDVDSMKWNVIPLPQSFYRFTRMVVTSTGDKAVFFNGSVLAVLDPSLTDESAWTIIPLNLTGSFLLYINVAPPVVREDVMYFFGLRDLFFAINMTSLTLIPNLAVLVGFENNPYTPTSSFYINDDLYFANNDHLFIFSTKKNVWNIALFPLATSTSTAVLRLQDKIYVNQMGMQYLYSPATKEWQSLNLTIPANASAVAVVADQHVVVAGGVQDGVALDVVNGMEFPLPPTPISKSEPQDQLTTSGSAPLVTTVAKTVVCLVVLLLNL